MEDELLEKTNGTAETDGVVELKDVMKCPKCGEEVSSKDQFCPNCGAVLSSPQKLESVKKQDTFCPNCGYAVGSDTEFCPNCGVRIKDNTFANPEPVKPVKEKPAVKPKPEKKETKKAPAEKMPREKKSSGKGVLIALLCVLLLAGAGVGVYLGVIKPGNTYKAAMELKEQQEYEKAYDLFLSLDKYKDSAEQASDCKAKFQDALYLQAYTAALTGNYEEALTMLKKISDYPNSQRLIDECKKGIVEDAAVFLASRDKNITSNGFNYIDDITGTVEDNGVIKDLHYVAENSLMRYEVKADVNYSYSGNSISVSNPKYEYQNMTVNSELSDDALHTLLLMVWDRYFSVNSNEMERYSSYKSLGNNKFRVRYVFATYEQSRYAFLTSYEDEIAYDTSSGQWTFSNHRTIGNYAEFKNIHDVQINIRSEPDKSGELRGVLDIDGTIKVNGMIDDIYVLYDNEYRWFSVAGNDQSEKWIAERRSQEWYKLVID